MNLQPFTCLNETTCTRFKHSFIRIEACCSVRNVPSYLTLTCGLLYRIISGVKLLFRHHHKMLVNELSCFVKDRFFRCSNNEMVDTSVSSLFS